MLLRTVILFAVIAAAAAGLAPGATPLIGKLIPQPAQAPANTEHAGYVSGLTPIVHEAVALPAAGPYAAEALPLLYARNYVAYSAPVFGFAANSA